MRKKFISLISLLAATTLMVACNKGEGTQAGTISYYGNSIDEGTISVPDDDGQDVVLGELDQVIYDFTNDLGVSVPSVEDFGLEYQVFYYYAYKQYVISASGADQDNVFEQNYYVLFTSDTNLVTANDETYTVEDYGYMFADANQKVLINFYTEDGFFYLSIYRNDGLYGSLDVSGIDTNWYVDYININGFSVDEVLPEDFLIKDFLQIESEVAIPSIDASVYPYLFSAAYEDEDGYTYPKTFYFVLEGDQLLDYGAVLEEAGYTVDIKENTDDFFGIEYYTVTAFDSAQSIYISAQLDESENTVVGINNFNDLFSSGKTTNTDWTDEEKALMNSTLHQVLPFMAFGSDYEIYDASDEDWTYLVIEDSYVEDLSSDYIAILLENGFFIDDTSYEDTYYCFDNSYAYIEIYVGYENGNYLEVYFEDSKLPALTSLGLNVTSLDIVAGATYQLEPVYNPSNATYPLTWSSSNENIATVSDKGLVTVKSDAASNSSVVITATALGGKTASCTFNVKANEVTGIAFDQDSYNVIPGGNKVQVAYSFLPLGVTSSEKPTFEITPAVANINVDSDGQVWASEGATVGTTATLKISFNGHEDTATIKVVSAEVKHTLKGSFFGIKEGESSYKTYNKTVDGVSYEAQASAGTDADNGKGLQIRSKNSNSGVIASSSDRTCKSITFTFDAKTEVTGKSRYIEIYASNTPFTIADMYGSSVTKVGTVTFDKNNLTQTYTFTAEYSYIGFRSGDGAVYLKTVEVVW